MTNITIQIFLKTMILTIQSKDLEICAKISNDLYFKTERIYLLLLVMLNNWNLYIHVLTFTFYTIL